MSMTNEKFAGAVKEIIHQKTIIASAQEQIKDIKDRMKEEFDFDKKELTKYADKYFQKIEKPETFNEEVDLMSRIYEELDGYDD